MNSLYIMKQDFCAVFSVLLHLTAMITSLDDAIGAIVKQMKDTGVWNNTFFLFTSDVGYSRILTSTSLIF